MNVMSSSSSHCLLFPMPENTEIEKKSAGYGLRDIFFSSAGGEVPNGHARVSPTDEEVPITMRSNANFTAVQQKLAVKKPFYKGIFK